MKKLSYFIVTMTLLVAFGNQGWLNLYKLRQFKDSFQIDIESLKRRNFALREEIQNLKNRDYIEHQIREELGFVKENEIVYEFSSSIDN